MRALVAYVEEVTGTEVAQDAPQPSPEKVPAPAAVDPAYNPLSIMEDFFTAQTIETASTDLATVAEEIVTPAEETASEEPAAEETADAPSEDPSLKAPKRGARKA